MSQRSNFYNRTPLHFAAADNDLEAVRTLMASGADPYIKDSIGNTPLSFAMGNQNEAMQQIMLGIPFISKETLSAPEKLLGYYSAILQMIREGHTESIRLCINRGIIDARFILTYDSFTPLHIAIHNQVMDIFNLFIETIIQENTPPYKLVKYLNFALKDGKNAMVKALINAGASPGELLLEAAFNGNIRTTLILLEAGADVNEISTHREWVCTPLIMAAATNQTDIARALLAANADPNKRNNISMSALTEAATLGNIELVDLLLNAGAKMCSATLTRAVKLNGKEIVNLLLEHAATNSRPDNLLATIKILTPCMKANDSLAKYYLSRLFPCTPALSEAWDNYKSKSISFFGSSLMHKMVNCLCAADAKVENPYQLHEICELALDPPEQSLRATLFSNQNKEISQKSLNEILQKYRAIKARLENEYGNFPPRYKNSHMDPLTPPPAGMPAAQAKSALNLYC